MDKLFAMLRVLHAGECVADPKKWKNRQITATLLAPVIVAAIAAARAFGVNVPISDDDALTLAGAVVVVVNLLLTAATSKHAGIPGAVAATADVGGVAQQPAAVPAPDAVSPFNESTGA